MNLTDFMHKMLGDRRDKTTALRRAGFENEADAVRWASSITPEPLAEISGQALIKQIRQARPDLTLATASYIARRARARHA